MKKIWICCAMALTMSMTSASMAAPICAELFNSARPKNEMEMGLKNWNRIKFSDGSELGLSVIRMTVDFGFVETYSLRGAFYFVRNVDGGREILNQTPDMVKFDYEDQGLNGKFIILKGQKMGGGSRLVVRIRVLQINLQTGLIQFGSVQLGNEVSKGWLAGKSTEALKTYPQDEVVSSTSSPIEQLTTISIDGLTGSTTGYFKLPTDLH